MLRCVFLLFAGYLNLIFPMLSFGKFDRSDLNYSNLEFINVSRNNNNLRIWKRLCKKKKCLNLHLSQKYINSFFNSIFFFKTQYNLLLVYPRRQDFRQLVPHSRWNITFKNMYLRQWMIINYHFIIRCFPLSKIRKKKSLHMYRIWSP